MSARQPLGIPYVPIERVGRDAFITCPHCKLRVKLARKDFESFSNAAYARHYAECSVRLAEAAAVSRAPLAHPEGCPDGCHNLPGVLVGVNGCEVQRCDECAPEWSDADAADALREAFPWIVVDFEPDRDEETGEVGDPSIGVFVVDAERCQIPDDVPTWLDAFLLDGVVAALLAQVEGLSEQRAQRALRQALHLLLSY